MVHERIEQARRYVGFQSHVAKISLEPPALLDAALADQRQRMREGVGRVIAVPQAIGDGVEVDLREGLARSMRVEQRDRIVAVLLHASIDPAPCLIVARERHEMIDDLGALTERVCLLQGQRLDSRARLARALVLEGEREVEGDGPAHRQVSGSASS